MPARKQRPKADFRLLSFMAINKGIRANQARYPILNFGKQSISNKPDKMANRMGFILTVTKKLEARSLKKETRI
jgi:hypothetical protein